MLRISAKTQLMPFGGHIRVIPFSSPPVCSLYFLGIGVMLDFKEPIKIFRHFAIPHSGNGHPLTKRR